MEERIVYILPIFTLLMRLSSAAEGKMHFPSFVNLNLILHVFEYISDLQTNIENCIVVEKFVQGKLAK